MSNPIDIQAIRERAEKATPGPWDRKALGGDSTILSAAKPARNDTRIPTYGYGDTIRGTSYHCIGYPSIVDGGDARWDFVCFNHADAEFIAASRTDIPTLCNALEAANARIAELAAFKEEIETEALDACRDIKERRPLKARLAAAEARIAEMEKALRDVIEVHAKKRDGNEFDAFDGIDEMAAIALSSLPTEIKKLVEGE